MDQQISLFDIQPKQMNSASDGCLKVVKSKFVETSKVSWHDLFDGFSELYGITFSSGIGFMEKVFDEFEHVEMIFGCEGILNDDTAAIISMQVKMVEEIVKSKAAKRLASRIEEGSLALWVSRDTMSHEKIFLLRAKDGRTRVVTGSANMSASAFLGRQRENIICFDDAEAFAYYKDLFEEFKENCSDSVTEQLLTRVEEDPDYVRDHIDEVPIVKTIEKKKIVLLDPAEQSDEAEIVADIRGLEKEIKPLLPKMKPENGKILLTGEVTKAFKRKYEENSNVKRTKEKKLPQLHIDFENRKLCFNGKEQNLNPEADKVSGDIECLTSFIDSLSSFRGDYRKSQKDYFKFMNWYFCSPFMPYLRFVGDKNEYSVTSFPVMGILYGESNGGKTTFVKLLSKLMTGVKVRPCSSNDFTSTNISNLKCACEGVPINIDDLAKSQFDNHFEKVIKDDSWGIMEHLINYPAVVITTNKLSSLKPDISKRVVTSRIDIKIEKERGAYNSKKINESMKHASNALFCEYLRRMFPVIDQMTESMRGGDNEYFPDVFRESSVVLMEILGENMETLPEYASIFSYSDYFGDLAVGKHAIDQIKMAWQTEPEMFTIDKKKNKLIYTYPENGRLYELKNLQEELPPVLEASVTARSLVMKLDAASDVFDEKFRKRWYK